MSWQAEIEHTGSCTQ